MNRIRTASIATLGCKLNQSESDRMARQLADAGVTLVPFGRFADLYVINSCTVTHVGDRKSRQLIRRAVRANPEAFVVVAGCYAEMEPAAVSAIEGVDAVVGNKGKDRLVEVLRGCGLEVGEGPNGAYRATARTPTLSLWERGQERTRAFVKIQEGCDNHCSYCIVPRARGHRRSRPAEEVVEEIRRLASEGHQEVVLTGVNITTYGRDYGSKAVEPGERGMGLLRLVERILAETEVPRIRLSSLQPEDWSPQFYDLWSSGRLCRHLHLSLQSGSDAVLKRMRRRYNGEQYAGIVAEAREALPGVAVTTDVIVGFPGETEAEFLETEGFLRSVGLAGFHVFKYSPRVGTPAAEMPDQVDPRAKQERSDRLMVLSEECGERFRSQFVGGTLSVLWEEPLPGAEVRKLGLETGDRAWWTGLSDNYVRVYATGSTALVGRIAEARVERPTGEGVVATLLD